MYKTTLLQLMRQPCLRLLTRGIRGGRASREVAFNQMKDDDSMDDWEAFDQMQGAEYQAIRQIENPKRTPQDFMAEEHHRKKVMNKIIEKRHFQQPQELNLLTWDAKEQIRYLNKEFPNEWTIDRLAESFPISREGVIRLLKSKWVPESIDRIVQHDKQVQARWLQIKAGKLKSVGPLASRYQQLLQEGKLHTLGRAAGHTALPSPNVVASLRSGSVTETSGSFHGIVKDYCDRKRQQQKQEDPQRQLQIVATSNRLLLADVTKAVKVSKSLNKEVMSSFSFTDENMMDQNEHDSNAVENIPQTLLDVRRPSKIESGVDRSKSLKKQLKENSRSSEEDEVKSHYKSYVGEPVYGTDMEYVKKKKQILKELKYEKSQDDGSSAETYRFDNDLGYQHPLGRVVDQPSRVNIKKSLRRKKRDLLYQKGDTFYDDSGDFLFRVPGMPDQH